MKNLILILILSFLFVPAQADHMGKMLVYGDGKYEGYFVTPTKLKTSTPAILLVHNWMGVTDETKYQAGRYADLGYIVLAADIYGKGQRPKDMNEAGKFAGTYKGDRKLFRERLKLGLDALLQQKNVDPENLAALGYCFGGTGVLELARSGAKIKGVVSFHGGLDSPSPADGKNIKSKVLIHHGAIDPFVPAKDIEAFEKEMRNNHVSIEMIKYPGAVHSFTDKSAGTDVSKGAAYNAEADSKSFSRTTEFLKSLFK
jgi:dienelactone hydrolase